MVGERGYAIRNWKGKEPILTVKKEKRENYANKGIFWGGVEKFRVTWTPQHCMDVADWQTEDDKRKVDDATPPSFTAGIFSRLTDLHTNIKKFTMLNNCIVAIYYYSTWDSSQGYTHGTVNTPEKLSHL